MILLETTKVIVDNLPKEAWWNSSLVTSIIGAGTGGFAAFLGIKWQIKRQRELEIQKKKVEIQIEQLDSILNSFIENINLVKDLQEYLANFESFQNDKKEAINFKKIFEYYYDDDPNSIYSSFDIVTEADVDQENLKKMKTFCTNIRTLKSYTNTNIFEELNEKIKIDKIKKIKSDENNWQDISKEFSLFFKEVHSEMIEYIYNKIPQEKLLLLDSIGRKNMKNNYFGNIRNKIKLDKNNKIILTLIIILVVSIALCYPMDYSEKNFLGWRTPEFFKKILELIVVPMFMYVLFNIAFEKNKNK